MSITPAAISALLNGDVENFVAASTPGGIEAQEAKGQRDLTSTFDRFPRDSGRRSPIPVAERYGFVFGDIIDDVFVAITPPEGWSLRPTEHSMWNDIFDADGVKRGSMFYKAAFYDRRALVNWTPRFAVDTVYGDDETAEIGGRDNKTGEWVIPPVHVDSYLAYDEVENNVRDALAERYPGWSRDCDSDFGWDL